MSTFHNFLFLRSHTRYYCFTLGWDIVLELFEKYSLHVWFLQELVYLHHVFNVTVTHHTHQTTSRILQQALGSLHYQSLQHISDDWFLDSWMPIEKISSSLLFLNIVSCLFEILGSRKLDHSSNYFVVFSFKISN